jgi:DNA modification methylase
MIEIIQGDCIDGLRSLPDESVHCVVTSPPYWGLRDYGQDGQIGLEDTPEAYTARMVDVFREVRRVLRDDGTLWLNLGDSYGNPSAGRNDGNHRADGRPGGMSFKAVGTTKHTANVVKPKDLVGIPWRVAFALQADGWWLRQDIIWHKPNPMPESVTDRCTKAHEYVFLLTKSARYFYDAEAISEEASTAGQIGGFTPNAAIGAGVKPTGNMIPERGREYVRKETRNKRSVWTVTTKPFSGAHFAVMPPDLVEPCVLAGCPEKICAMCGAPWERLIEKGESTGVDGKQDNSDTTLRHDAARHSGRIGERSVRTVGHRPSCECGSGTQSGTVLDPFGGAGTTALVADRLGRNAIICELNPEYVNIAAERLRGDNPLFSNVTVREAV